MADSPIPTDTELAAYMISRICHDFASPLTSVCNGVELMESDNEMLRSQALELLVDGAAASLARLVFVRYAFGSVGMQPGQADIGELRSVIAKFFDSPRLVAVWDGPEDVSFVAARIGLNLAVIAASCLPVGGKIHIQASTGISATAHGDTIRVADSLSAALRGEAPDDGWNARSIHPVFAFRICAEQGLALEVHERSEAVEILAR